MRIVIASNNAKKRKEMIAILAGLGVAVMPAEATAFVYVDENGETFAENAGKKAEAFAHANHLPALADDSGLCVDALAGEPGVYSSRFAGEHADDTGNNRKLLQEMATVEERDAHFVCALHLAFPDEQQPIVAEGRVDGVILNTPDGEHGFGYDPLFYSTELKKSFAFATAEEKASVSHRGRALRNLAEQLKSIV
ncbi:MAG: RdgB/HAM1 family non-canonical purine NTP pyrophosphatase [Mariprofundaceae bacterium]|nr:RdgB/HAM1 family non-canonical purine NTP pyrophosphatase [Mariprofundaceae bacterium]